MGGQNVCIGNCQMYKDVKILLLLLLLLLLSLE